VVPPDRHVEYLIADFAKFEFVEFDFFGVEILWEGCLIVGQE
jgi:hypothetical protein